MLAQALCGWVAKRDAMLNRMLHPNAPTLHMCCIPAQMLEPHAPSITPQSHHVTLKMTMAEMGLATPTIGQCVLKESETQHNHRYLVARRFAERSSHHFLFHGMPAYRQQCRRDPTNWGMVISNVSRRRTKQPTASVPACSSTCPGHAGRGRNSSARASIRHYRRQGVTRTPELASGRKGRAVTNPR